MRYIKLIDGVPTPYTFAQLRKDNPQVSFPATLSNELLQSMGLMPLTVLPGPTFDEQTHYLKASVFYQVGDRWQQHYTPEPLLEERVAASIRAERNERLSATDWTQVADAPVDTAAWAAYRQALRNVTEQAGFPTDVEWPEQPL